MDDHQRKNEDLISELTQLRLEKAVDTDLYRTLIEKIDQPVSIIQLIFNEIGDPLDYITLYMNPAAETQLGLKREETIGRRAKEIGPNAEPEWFTRYGEVVKSGISASFERRSSTFNRYFNNQVIPLGNDKIAILFQDITELRVKEEAEKNAIEALRESEAKMRDAAQLVEYQNSKLNAVIQSLPHGLVMYDKNANPIFYNEQSLKGYNKAIENKDIPMADRVQAMRPKHKEGGSAPTEEMPIMRALKGEVVKDLEMSYISRCGETLWVSSSTAPIINDDGEISGAVATYVDITERKQNEQALRDSEQRFRLATQAAGMYTWELDVATGDVRFSGDVKGVIGFSYTENDDVFSRIGRYVNPEDGARHQEALLRTMRGEGDLHSVNRVIHPDTGEIVWLETHATLMRADDGTPQRVFGIARNITESKRVEEELQDYQLHLEALVEERTRQVEEAVRQRLDVLESISDCFYSLDADLRFTYVNRGAENAWGLSRDELIGRKIDEIFPGIIDTSLGKFRQVLQEKEPQHYELYSNVIQSWVYMSVYPTREGISVFWHDISEQKNIEFQLKQSQQYISDILTSIKDPFFTLDREWVITYANQAAQEPFTHFGTIIGKNIWDLFPHGVGSIFWDTYHAVMNSKAPQCFETKIENTGFWRLVDVYPRVDGISVLFRDITERKRAEEALRQSEERFAKIFYYSPYGMAIVRIRDNQYMNVNQKFLDLTRYSRAEVVGSTPLQLNLYAENGGYTDSLLAEIESKGDIDNREHRIRTKSGSIVILRAASVMVNIDGEPCRITIIEDITGEKAIEKEMARLDRLNLIGEMAASIGHEIRNPMTAVRGFLQMLGSKPEYQGDSSYFELMIEELDRANAIITEYLSMAKDKRVELQPRSLNLVVKAIWPVIQSDANLREIKLEFELSDIPQPLIDESEIRQLILNMARNGMEAMSMGGKLTIGTRHEANQVVLYIKDEGHGVNPDLMERLGTPFLTTKDNGTGLGLAVCYSIAARHDARIDCETGPEGTTFYVRFPLQQ